MSVDVRAGASEYLLLKWSFGTCTRIANAMAKAELDILLNKLQGRLSGDSEYYLAHRYGKTVVSNYPLHKNPKSLSPNQRATFAAFGEISKQVKLEMQDPARLSYWQDQYTQYTKLADNNLNHANAQFFGEDSAAFIKQKYYSTLRGFILARLAKQQKPAE